MLYQAYQLQSDLTSPLRLLAQWAASALWTDTSAGTWVRRCSAGSEVLSRLRLTHTRPDFGITQITSGADTFMVEEDTTAVSPFGSLLHFRKLGAPTQPAVMLIAPLSGHFATLLRETARTLLQDHDVYITDWRNARDVPLRHGAYGLDDYIDNLMMFSESITAATGQRAHWVAVCQPMWRHLRQRH